jgi:hypothetical protein
MKLMKERIVVRTVRREFFIILLFSSMAFVCFNNKANAQGWTFTPQIKLTGNCVGAGAAVAQANAILATIGNMAMPSKSQCESLRQQILSIQVGGGECVVGYTCTPCAGSDLPSSGQIGTPGQINSNAALQGKSFFSAHESSAFEDWATEYKQLLASYGITSILGKNITPRELPKTPMTPMTGNPALNATYANLAVTFNPPEQGGVVDLRESKQVDDFLSKKVVMPGDALDYTNKVNETYGIKLIDMPALPNGEREIKNEVVENIETTRGILVDVVGLLPPGLNYAAIAMVDGLAPLATVIYNCAIRTPPDCPPSLGVDEANKALINIIQDVPSAIVGDIGGKVLSEFKGFKATNLTNDAKVVGIGIIDDINHYKTMPVSEVYNLVTRSKIDIKLDIIPTILDMSGNIIIDNTNSQENNW